MADSACRLPARLGGMAADASPHVLTRTEFYHLVWSTPLTTLAKRFGVAGAPGSAIVEPNQQLSVA
jgi:hypothetical protein